MNRVAGSVSARQVPVGGDVRQNPQADPLHWYAGEATVVLLVHGYNVSQAEADASYARFTSLLPRRLNGVFGAAYWPGDAARFSGLMYPWKIESAIRSGEALGTFVTRLKRLSPATRVIIVAHSLGCRVTLELMDRLFIGPMGATAPIDLIYLMAAAVPVGHLEPGGRLARSKLVANRRLSFHSTRDVILQVWFRLGEPAAWAWPVRTETGLHFKAAGIDGEPAPFWSDTVNSHPNGHGGYWTDARIARKLALELGAAPVNLLAAHGTSTRSTVAERRPPAHVPHSRPLSRRQ